MSYIQDRLDALAEEAARSYIVDHKYVPADPSNPQTPSDAPLLRGPSWVHRDIITAEEAEHRRRASWLPPLKEWDE